MGCSVDVEKMTIRFKGHHHDNLRITYKAEGDGFQANALCYDVYSYQVYMQNDPALKKYLKQNISPLHSQTVSLFYYLKDKHHQVGMNNIYNSAAFCRSAYHPDCKVLCHSVACKAGRRIPECVLQDEENNPVTQRAARGTVKAAVLEGDLGCPNIIASSVYDTNTVHCLSMVSKSIQWVQKEKMVYNVDNGKVEALKFLKLNQIDKYNNGMGDVDVAEQLRGI